MAATKQFSTGGGFPHDNSAGRTIEFTLSYGKSELLDPNSTQPSYTYHIEFSNPEDRAYVCAMYGPPRDEEGLNAFARQLGNAYRTVSNDPSYAALPVPPLPYETQYGADREAEFQIKKGGGIAQGCLWAQQFGPGTNLAIDIANSPGAKTYRAQAIGGDNRIVAEQSGLAGDFRNAPLLSRRATASDGSNNGVGSPYSPADGFDAMIPTQPTSLPQAESNPVRRLVRLNSSTSPAVSVAASDHQSYWDDRFGSGASSLDGNTPRNPNFPALPPEAEGPLGIVSGQPMRFFQFPIFDTRTNSGAAGDPNRPAALENLLWKGGRFQGSAIDTGAPALPVIQNRQISPAPETAWRLRRVVPAIPTPPTSAPRNSQGALSLNDAYLEYLKRLNANPSPASAIDTDAPGAPLVPSDDSEFSGGLLGRLMAVTGIDLQNPDQLAPTPQDDELRAFYRDNPVQPWTLQRRR